MRLAKLGGALVMLFACKSTEGDRFERAISEMESFRAQMCACKEKACSDAVARRVKEWERGMDAKFGSDDQQSDAITARAKKISEATLACYQAVVNPPRPASADESGSAAADPVLAKMIGFKDRACACKDQACIDAVHEDMTKFANEQALDPIVTPATTTKDHSDKMTAVSKQLVDCIVKIMSQP